MKHLYLAAAALIAAATALPAQAQNPFEQQTKAVYIYSVNHNQFLSDYQSPTPATYCLQDYGASRRDAILFELTTLNELTGEGVLFTPWTDSYMSVPAGGSFVKSTTDVDKRTILTFKDAGDGHKAIYSGTTLLSPYKNGAIMLLVGYTEAHQAAGWGKVEEALWDIVEAEDLDAFLTAHGIDPESDPYVTPVDPVDPEDPDEPDEPDPDKATFEDLQYAVLAAQQALFAVQGGYVADDKRLITSADQFVSDYSDADEGADFNALIDFDNYTFWHSDWHGAAPEGAHSFDVLLPENNDVCKFVAEYCGRINGNNCAPVEMSLYGGQVTGGEERRTIDDAPFTALTRQDGIGAFAGWGHSSNSQVLSGSFFFEADDVYTALRFEATHVMSDAGDGAEACFNYSEFQLYAAKHVAPTAKADVADVDNLEALVGEALELDKTEDPTELVAALQAATAKVADPSSIHSVIATLPADARIYDLQGRRVASGSCGLYIQGGRKVVK